MHDLGTFHRLGDFWLHVLSALERCGTAAIYTDNIGELAEARELFCLTAEIQDASLPDPIIEKYKTPSEYDWMVRNFTVQGDVPELCGESSYASRLYAYMGEKDQVEWLIQRLRSNPTTRSATITMFEPLTDEGYIPCVSLLDFQLTDGRLDMTAYCRALDFGCKAYVNLVMLHLIHKKISEDTGIPCGKLILLIKSAHFYVRDRDKILHILQDALPYLKQNNLLSADLLQP